MGNQLDLDDVSATSPLASKELREMRDALDALLEIVEQSVDTRTCSIGILRAMNTARKYLAPNKNSIKSIVTKN